MCEHRIYDILALMFDGLSTFGTIGAIIFSLYVIAGLITLEFNDFCKQNTEKQFDENKHLNEQTRFIYNKLKKLL